MIEIRRLGVFCGSSTGRRAVYVETARALGTLLAREGIGLVYGGAQVGLMGIVADAVLADDGEATGVLPYGLARKEIAHPRLTRLHLVDSMHERKALMADLSDAFVALPGGLGTLEELTEMLTWGQLGIHRKPCGLLNVDGYFDGFIAFLDHAATEGFLRPMDRASVFVETEPDVLLKRLRAYDAPEVVRWITREET